MIILNNEEISELLSAESALWHLESLANRSSKKTLTA